MQVLAQFFKNGVKRKGGQLLVRTTKLNMIILMMMMVRLTTMLII